MAAQPSNMEPAGRSTDATRRALRGEYRTIDAEARSKPEVLAHIHNGELISMVKRNNELFQRVEKPREGAMDAGFFCKLTQLGAQATAKLLTHQQGRTLQEFVNALRHNHVGSADPHVLCMEDPGAFRWAELGEQVRRCFKPAPGASCMLGPMDVQTKVRRVAQRQNRRPTGEAVRPEELHEIQEQDKQETDHNMEAMWNILHHTTNCPVVELVLNHRCFAQTIENLFTLAFLVRDQRAYLWHDEQQGMMVRVVDPKGGLPAPTVPGKRPDEQLQFVMALNMDDWEHMCRVVKPDDTKMPHRDQSAAMALNQRGTKRQQQQQQQQGEGEDGGAGGEAGPSSRSAPPAGSMAPPPPRTKKSRG